MRKPANHDAELLADVADLIAEFPDVPLADLASDLERHAAVYDNGPAQARAVAAELRRQGRLL